VEGDQAAALALLGELAWVRAVAVRGDMLLLDAPAGRAAELNRLLTQHNIGVAEIGAREHSLESFFLEVTGDG
jgi:hypothetical protein